MELIQIKVRWNTDRSHEQELLGIESPEWKYKKVLIDLSKVVMISSYEKMTCFHNSYDMNDCLITNIPIDQLIKELPQLTITPKF